MLMIRYFFAKDSTGHCATMATQPVDTVAAQADLIMLDIFPLLPGPDSYMQIDP